MRLSIIIPTFNRGGILNKAVELIEKQTDLIQDEIIIVDDGSEKSSILIEKQLRDKFKNIKLILNSKVGPAKLRNIAVDKSKGKYLLFLNDDSFIDKDFIKHHLNFHKRNTKTDAGLVGLTRNHPKTVDMPIMKWLVGQSGLHFNYGFDQTGGIKEIPWFYLWTCNFSVKESFVRETKLRFCEEFPSAAWEDIEFAYRAKESGLKLFFEKRAVVYHYHELSFRDIKNRFVSHGRGLYHIKGKLPDNFLPFLVKNKLGYYILLIMHNSLASITRDVVESILDYLNVYPNWVMQWLVVKWKSDGYFFEKR